MHWSHTNHGVILYSIKRCCRVSPSNSSSNGDHDLIPRNTTCRHSSKLLASDSNLIDLSIKECRCGSRNSDCTLTQLESHSFSLSSINKIYRVDDQEEIRWSLIAERLSRRTNGEKENHCRNNLEDRLAGKRKMCDLNVNLVDNLECLWDEDSIETSDSGSDSEAYSGTSMI